MDRFPLHNHASMKLVAQRAVHLKNILVIYDYFNYVPLQLQLFISRQKLFQSTKRKSLCLMCERDLKEMHTNQKTPSLISTCSTKRQNIVSYCLPIVKVPGRRLIDTNMIMFVQRYCLPPEH